MLSKETMALENGQILTAAERIAADIKAGEGVEKNRFWFSDPNDVAPQWKIERRKRLQSIAETAARLRKADIEAARTAQYERELESNNVFTLVSLCYDNPRDTDAYEALERAMPGACYNSETVYDFMFWLGMIQHDIEDIETTGHGDEESTRVLERAIRDSIAKLPRERDVYRELKRIFAR